MKKLIFSIVLSVVFLSVPYFVDARSCALEDGAFYTHSDTRTVWKIDKDTSNSCTKRAVKSAKVYFTYEDDWSAVQSVAKNKIESIKDDSLGFIPLGPKYNPKGGALVKIPSDNRVYLLLDGKKYWITDQVVFNNLNYKWDWIQDVDPDLLNKYKTRGKINYTDHHPVGSLVKYYNNKKVYRIEKNESGELIRRHIKNKEVFNKLGHRFDRVVTIDNKEQYKIGTPITLQNWNQDKNNGKSLTKLSEEDNNDESIDFSNSEHLYPAEKNGKWGYINRKGEWEIEPKFYYAKPFFEGRAAVAQIPLTSFDDKDTKWGIINKSGDFVVKPEYGSTMTGMGKPQSSIGHYSDGLVPVNAKNAFGSFEWSKAGSEEYLNNKVFYFDREGNKKFAGEFDKVGQFSDGLAPVVVDNKVGYINKQGETVIKPKFSDGKLYSNGLIPVNKATSTFGEKWSYIDNKGDTIIKGPYDTARSFYSGLALVENNFEQSYVDTNGNVILGEIKPMEDGTNFRESIGVITKKTEDWDRYEIAVNKQGKKLFNYDDLFDRKVCAAEPFHHGLSQVILSSDNSCSYTTNKSTPEDMVDIVLDSESSTYAYVDKGGNVVYRGENSEKSEDTISVSEGEKRDIEQLFENSSKAAENENWEKLLNYYSVEGRANLLNQYYQSITLMIGFAEAFSGNTSSTAEQTQELNKIKQDWEDIVKKFDLQDSFILGQDLSEKEIENKFSELSLSKQAEFLKEMVALFDEADQSKEKPSVTNFTEIKDIKIKDDKGAVLMQESSEKGIFESESRSIIKKDGEWKWFVDSFAEF